MKFHENLDKRVRPRGNNIGRANREWLQEACIDKSSSFISLKLNILSITDSCPGRKRFSFDFKCQSYFVPYQQEKKNVRLINMKVIKRRVIPIDNGSDTS